MQSPPYVAPVSRGPAAYRFRKGTRAERLDAVTWNEEQTQKGGVLPKEIKGTARNGQEYKEATNGEEKARRREGSWRTRTENERLAFARRQIVHEKLEHCGYIMQSYSLYLHHASCGDYSAPIVERMSRSKAKALLRRAKAFVSAGKRILRL